VLTCSVVLATLNGAEHLPAQLASIRDQLRLPDELVISDDGSSDATVKVAEDFRQTAPFSVRVIAGPRQGCAENFWSAAESATSQVIAWSDQDDVWHREKLARCLAAIEERNAAMAVHAAAVVGPGLQALGRKHPGYSTTRLLGPLEGDPLLVPPGFAIVFRRQLMDELDWASRPLSHQHRYQLPHDHAVWLWAFACHRRVELRDSLALYRQHTHNLAGAPPAADVGYLKAALGATAEQYERLAERLTGYATWLEGAGQAAAGDYFRQMAERARMRGRVRDGPGSAARWAGLATALRRDAYASRDRGGFGARALANDALSVCAGLARARPTLGP